MRLNLGPLSPFVVSGLGCLADFVTTRIGLSCGFVETHVKYSPVVALSIFWGALAVCSLAGSPRKGSLLLACLSWLGAVNNVLVLLGVFGGLVI